MNKFKHFDWLTIAALGLVSFIGLANVFSATFVRTYSEFNQQIIFLIIGFAAFVIFSLINVKVYRLSAVTYSLLIIGLLLLLVTLVLPSNGPKRWINLGSVAIQTSEIGKLLLGISLPYILTLNKRYSNAIYFVILGLYSFLTIIQPSLGNGITILLIGIILFLINQPKPLNYFLLLVLTVINIILGPSIFAIFSILILLVIKFKPIVLAICLLLIAISLIPLSNWVYQNQLTEYQKVRVQNFLAPDNDPLGSGWQLSQAKIAIQSGGFGGSGYLQSNQINNGFLTYAHTDFAYTSILSQFGLIAATFVVGLYGFIIYRVLNWKSSHVQGELTKYFVCIVLFVQMVLHLLINYGFLPVSGIPWPIISSGGSILLVAFALLGIAHSWHISNKLQQDVW